MAYLKPVQLTIRFVTLIKPEYVDREGALKMSLIIFITECKQYPVLVYKTMHVTEMKL